MAAKFCLLRDGGPLPLLSLIVGIIMGSHPTILRVRAIIIYLLRTIVPAEPGKLLLRSGVYGTTLYSSLQLRFMLRVE